MYALGFSTVFAAYVLSTPGFRARETFGVEATVVGLSVLAAILVFVVVATRRLQPTTVLDIGLLFEVAGGFGISMVEHWGFFSGADFKIFGVSWLCVWIVVFPVIIPSTQGKTMLAALATATTGIVAYTLSTAFYRADSQSLALLVQLFLPNYVCTFVALLTARIVHNLGAKVSDARRLGAYELVEPLGRGGMGEVWRARHRFLSRPAAIKLIRSEVLSGKGGADPRTVLNRFEREAEATASLQSPHSIVLYDFGSTQRGVLYYVMELLSGFDLQRLVERFGPVPAHRTAFILDQICHSLEDAHAAGLIHRDVKPANIYLCRLGGDHDFVKVLDFGIVKRMQPTAGTSMALTGHGFCGTPGFIAPEIILGASPGTPRTDVYSLGCVAYWLLTGKLVFSAETPDGIIGAHITSDPIPPSERVRSEVPSSMEAMVMTCLERKPERRFATVAELRSALRSVELRSRWTNDDAREWWESNDPLVDTHGTTQTIAAARPPRVP